MSRPRRLAAVALLVASGLAAGASPAAAINSWSRLGPTAVKPTVAEQPAVVEAPVVRGAR